MYNPKHLKLLYSNQLNNNLDMDVQISKNLMKHTQSYHSYKTIILIVN